MHAYGVTSLDPTWLLVSAEKREHISDDHSLPPLLILLTIVIGLVWLHFHRTLVENREPNINPNPNEVQHVEEMDIEHPAAGELDNHYFDGDDRQLRHRTTTRGGTAAAVRYPCVFCGNPSTTRCSRCKVARYCSMACHIRHWRSGHKYECFETEKEADEARHIIHDRGTTMLVEKSDKESIPDGDGVEWRSDASNGSDVNSFHGCEVCGSPSTTKCSRCKAVGYCSAKCLIMDWRWHKDHCIAGDVNSAPTERPNRDVGEVLKNSYEEEEKIHASATLSLEFHPVAAEGNPNNLKSPIKVSQPSQDPTKEIQVHRTEWVKLLEDELVKSRKEILSLQSEREEWKNRANFARERFQSLKKESEHKLFLLRNEKDSISNAEKKACNVIHTLHERLNHLQIAVQESIAEKRKLEEHIQMVESECAKLKRELQEEHKRAQCLTLESNKSHETAQIAIREVEAVRQELQEERKHVRRLKEDFLRDVTIAESRAAFAEAKLSDLHRKFRLTDKVPIVTDSLGRPAMACTICLTNEKDLAFGCGHMTCRDCGSKLSKCPLCREEITSHIRLFPG